MARKKVIRPKNDTLNTIADRFGVTAREARDIATAVSTLAKTATQPKNTNLSKSSEIKAATKNLKKQIKETGRAATTGKTGTTSAQKGYPKMTEYKPGTLGKKTGSNPDNPFFKGRKRSKVASASKRLQGS